MTNPDPPVDAAAMPDKPRRARTENSRQERILTLHRKLKAARRPIPVATLLAELGCSKATLYRDFAFLRDALGAPLLLGGEPSAVRYVERDGETAFELPGLWLSSGELHALIALYEMASRRTGAGPLNEALTPLKGRIARLLEAETGRSGWPEGRIRVVASTPRRLDEGVFRAVASATLEGWRLAFDYDARSTGRSNERIVSPQRLVHYRDNWYLDAFDHGRDGVRSFAVDRIDRPRILDQPVEQMAAGELDQQVQAGYGIFSGPARATAVIRFSAKASRWVADERWHAHQEGRWLADGRYELRLPYSNSRELLGDILRHGADAEIVAPLSLREQARSMLELAIANYDAALATGADVEAGMEDGNRGDPDSATAPPLVRPR